MSLIMAFCTTHGIIMSGDRCITTTLDNKKSFCSTMSERKLFLSKKGFGFSYAGSSTFRNKPASYWMERFIMRFDGLDISLYEYVKKLSVAFHTLDNSRNIILVGCGYQNLNPCVYSVGSSNLTLVDHIKDGTCIAFAGESNLARTIIEILPLDQKSFTLHDAIQFVQHVTLTLSNAQRFAQTQMTISPKCDILKITAANSEWITRPSSM